MFKYSAYWIPFTEVLHEMIKYGLDQEEWVCHLLVSGLPKKREGGGAWFLWTVDIG